VKSKVENMHSIFLDIPSCNIAPQLLRYRVFQYIYIYTVDSRLSAVMVGRIGADNQNQRINRSTHTQPRYEYTGIKLTSLIFYAIN
jgi:hypothetical protein